MSFTDQLFQQFRGQVTNVDLQSSSGGAFEVKVNDELVYSKLQEGSFPDEETLIQTISEQCSLTKM